VVEGTKESGDTLMKEARAQTRKEVYVYVCVCMRERERERCYSLRKILENCVLYIDDS
jgi:hypothetical protein